MDSNIASAQEQDLSNLSPQEAQRRRREWNRGPLEDLFPRIPHVALERLLDICIDKDFTYNLSQSKFWNARRYTSIVVANVRHFYTNYDKLLREERLERYEARRASAESVWKTLREWCPWDSSNEALRRCFEASIIPPELRDPTWDPMDIDESDDEASNEVEAPADPMDLD